MRFLTLPAAAVVLTCLAATDGDAAKLTVRVTDAETEQILPARLALRAADGSYPGDRLRVHAGDWPGPEAHAVFIPGEQTFDLPPGRTSLTAAQGPQYGTGSITVDLRDDVPATAELKLRRVTDLRKIGWVGGDAHIHMIHGEMQRRTSYADVATTCRASGLDWALVNQEYVGAGKLDLAGYQAACAAVSTPEFRLALGGERSKSLLGHHALIGVANPFVVPDDPPYYTGARAVHAQGGVLFPVHPVRYFPEKQYRGEWLDFPGNNLARELVFDAFLGPSFDGLSVLSDDPANPTAHQLWFNLLNRGLFVPAAADSDACFDRPAFGYHAPGFWVTYINTGPGGTTDPAALARGFRAGRTFATTGPLVLFAIDGRISGSTIPPDGKPHRVRIRATHPHHNWTLQRRDASGQTVGIGKVELIRNGQVVKVWEPNQADAESTATVAESGPCWYAARVYGSDRRWQVAVASLIYFANEPVPIKRQPLAITVRGRSCDFRSGVERRGAVEVRRGDQLLARFTATG